LLDGMDLQRLVERFGPLPAARAVPILLQACAALSEAHGKGIIHRDIKPSNIFLCLHGGIADFVKVLDFGLAKELRNKDTTELTQTGELLGTPRYIAPESVGDKETVDARTDIYMLGSVAYWMLSGKAPFEDASGVDVIVKHLTEAPRPPSQVTELPIPPELEKIVMRCLEKRKEDRFQNVDELSRALQDLALEETWDQEKAREWWNLHFTPSESPTVEPEGLPESGLPTLCPRRAG
ncbi:MAG TPA: serine/threonine-protein kinase, partial [bacterium]|nr:serine/threonine-protein kinase [bacterium]